MSITLSGLGLITPIGHRAWQNIRRLLDGDRLTDRLDRYLEDVPATDLIRGIGGVGITTHNQTDPAITLAEAALREAAADAGCDLKGLPCFIGTSKGAIHTCQEGGFNGNPLSEGALQGYTEGPCEHYSRVLRNRLGIHDMGHYIAACASSLTALHQARMWLLRQPAGTRCAVLSSESALTDHLIASYHRLGVLAPPSPKTYRQTPLAAQRGGFVLASCGAAIILTRQDENEGPAGYARLLDTGCLAEAYDLIRSPERMEAIIQLAKRFSATLAQHQIELAALHPHATGTIEHDPAEMAALAEGFRKYLTDVPVPCYAVKGALGHTLGAAGLSALIIAALCLRTRRLPPMPWLSGGTLDMPQGLSASQTPVTLNTGAHAAFAAGFGGHVAGAMIGPL